MDKIRVSHITHDTKDSVLVTLEVPSALEQSYRYLPGQYLTLETIIEKQNARRSYSICSCPEEGVLRVGIKRIPNGLFSTYAKEQLKVGDFLDALPPSGKFTTALDGRYHIFFAAGSGITPVFPMIKTKLSQDPTAIVQLFFVNQTVSSIMLKEEIESLKNQFLDRIETFYFLTRQSRHTALFDGRIDFQKLEALKSANILHLDQTAHYYACGPEAMIMDIKQYLTAQEISSNHIHFELFYSDKSKQKNESNPGLQGQHESNVSVIEGGKTMVFKMSQGGDSILDAALSQSADLPYACKGGVCSTCKAKVVKGDVEMLLSYGLEQDEIDSGYVLTCQTFPLSEEVIVDFDA